jgi:hypothetical protein
MNPNLIIAVIVWLFAGLLYGLDQIMYRHGTEEFNTWSKKSPLFAIESHAILFGGIVIMALLRTILVISPELAVADLGVFESVLVIELVMLGSLYLFWKSFPKSTSFFGWKHSRVPVDEKEEAASSNQSIPSS